MLRIPWALNRQQKNSFKKLLVDLLRYCVEKIAVKVKGVVKKVDKKVDKELEKTEEIKLLFSKLFSRKEPSVLVVVNDHTFEVEVEQLSQEINHSSHLLLSPFRQYCNNSKLAVSFLKIRNKSNHWIKARWEHSQQGEK